MVATGIRTLGIQSGTTALENNLVGSQQVKHIYHITLSLTAYPYKDLYMKVYNSFIKQPKTGNNSNAHQQMNGYTNCSIAYSGNTTQQ